MALMTIGVNEISSFLKRPMPAGLVANEEKSPPMEPKAPPAPIKRAVPDQFTCEKRNASRSFWAIAPNVMSIAMLIRNNFFILKHLKPTLITLELAFCCNFKF